MRIALLGIILGLAAPAMAHPRGPAPRPRPAVRVEPVVHVHEAPVYAYRVRPAYPTPAIGMHPVRFQRLLERVSRMRFEDEREQLLARAARRHDFSSEQVEALIDALPYGRERLSALRILVPSIVDPENRFMILDAFHRRWERREAARILRHFRPEGYYGPAA